jgi:hypothetical protein
MLNLKICDLRSDNLTLVMKREFKQCLSTIPLISTKQTNSHIKPLNTNDHKIVYIKQHQNDEDVQI